MKEIIDLDPKKRIFSGRQRDVYAHPEDKRLLLKVTSVDYYNRKSKLKKNFFKKYYLTKVFVREVKEYIHLHSFKNINYHYDFVQKIVGFQSTNLGFALVVKAELDKEGNYAPTLKQLLDRKKFNNQIKEDLNYFIKQLRTSSLSVYDLNPNNLVYSRDVRLFAHRR